ncbi:MAG: LysR family transcriptional regulator [Candidatus Methanomethylophilaceae archaeon]|jgi:DNA-binding transcriptional LysR family regulator|nr:LysR family transcriptional regulator [Candidatus Methanomethylophilaceae archaeon]
MDIKAQVSLEINGTLVTFRQLEALLAVQDYGSQASAARKLGISAPVLNKYISSISAAAGADVLKTTPSGSVLTAEGAEIAAIARSMGRRCETGRPFTVCCSPVTEEMVLSAMSSANIPRSRVVISDDENSIMMMRERRADFAVIDDPLYLFDADDFEMQEIAYMGMVFVDNGPSFMKYAYGAQRVAYMFLDSTGRRYTVDSVTQSLQELVNSGKSFFVDEAALARKNIRYKSAIDPKMLRHAVTAIYKKETRNISRLMKALASMPF